MVVLKPCRFFMVTSRFQRTLEVNNFVSVDFQTQISIRFLISMKFCTRIINKKKGGGGGVRKCNSADIFWMEQGQEILIVQTVNLFCETAMYVSSGLHLQALVYPGLHYIALQSQLSTEPTLFVLQTQFAP